MESLVISNWGGVGVEGSCLSHPKAECPSQPWEETEMDLPARASDFLLCPPGYHTSSDKHPSNHPQGLGPSLDIT